MTHELPLNWTPRDMNNGPLISEVASKIKLVESRMRGVRIREIQGVINLETFQVKFIAHFARFICRSTPSIPPPPLHTHIHTSSKYNVFRMN